MSETQAGSSGGRGGSGRGGGGAAGQVQAQVHGASNNNSSILTTTPPIHRLDIKKSAFDGLSGREKLYAHHLSRYVSFGVCFCLCLFDSFVFFGVGYSWPLAPTQ